jgi:hypothetical protein
MPKTVKSKQGDSLCSIAIANGFKNCDALRAEAANSKLLKTPLPVGSLVTVPDLTKKEETISAGQSVKIRRYGTKTKIRFVHGSPDLPYKQDVTLNKLNISNFRTNKGGSKGTKAFPAGYGYHKDGHADPDTFKIEIDDQGAGGSVDATLEALKPVYRPDGVIDKHERFGGAEANKRKLDITCNEVKAGEKVYRSTYLRLVSDDQDQSTVPAQTLLVTDMADGNKGDNDKIEILDQKVRAYVKMKTCKAADPDKCIISAELPVGEDPKRIRLCIHAFRTAPGNGSPVVGGITEQMLRRRAMKWFRRAYAQASLSPKLVGPEVEFIDPPPPNMIVICQDHGRTASGVNGSGNPSTLSFRLGQPPAVGMMAPILNAVRTISDPTVTVNLTAGLTPLQVGQAIAGALPAGFNASAAENSRTFNAANGSCDVIITHTDGRRVVIYGETTDDARVTIAVARVNINQVNSADNFNNIIPTTMEFRRVLRSVAGADDRLDCFVVGAFTAAGLRGRAFVPGVDLGAAFRPRAPLRWAAIMGANSSSGAVMDGGDNLPFTFPHEAGHVLTDAFHTDNADPNGPTELMSGAGTSAANSVNATKRICGGAYKVKYACFNPVQANPGDAHSVEIEAVDRLRTRGANVFEGW